jgi:FtsP/CotA-like multicopper oxidase with cupredoxin domain
MFDMNSGVPDIVAQQGTVEDWIIENRSNELHAFHIHQLHFLLLDYMGRAVNEDFLRDTVNVPYYDGRSLFIPAFACAWISATRTRWARSSITAIFWNTKTKG